jgi:hypothetical protein
MPAVVDECISHAWNAANVTEVEKPDPMAREHRRRHATELTPTTNGLRISAQRVDVPRGVRNEVPDDLPAIAAGLREGGVRRARRAGYEAGPLSLLLQGSNGEAALLHIEVENVEPNTVARCPELQLRRAVRVARVVPVEVDVQVFLER